MRILVTGSSGFIGSHLCAELETHGHRVFRVDYDGNAGGDRDLRLPWNAQRLIRFHSPDVVVHLAAKVGRLFGEKDAMDTVADNAGMTALVAKAAGEAGARIVYASTSEIYGDNGDQECDETDGPFTLPHNLYGLSKRWGEEACRLYAPDGLTILRFSMPYGPGLPAGKGRAAIINMLWQALHHRQIPVHKGAERAWCWIGDTVRAARLAIEHEPGGVFNIGRDDNPASMLRVARIACDLTGADINLIRIVDPPGMQTVVKRLSSRRIRELGWTPEVDLEDGMAKTLEWVRSLDRNGDPVAA